MNRSNQGFTAVELLVTLFVAAAFLIAGYQLFSLVIRDGGSTRAEANASNVAYDYLREYELEATNPCIAFTPISQQPIDIPGLVDETVTVDITCPSSSTPAVSQVTVKVDYNNPVQEVTVSNYVTGNSQNNTITEGLVAWFPLNGNGTDAVTGDPGTNNGATPTSNTQGVDGRAMSFNGTTNFIRVENRPEIGNLTSNFTASAWFNKTETTTTQNIFSATRITTANGIALSPVLGGTVRLTTLGVRDYNSTTATFAANTWTHMVAVMGATDVTYYVNGVQRDTITHTVGGTANSDDPYYIGAGTATGTSTLSTPFAGSIDDIRLYNRQLTPSEIQTLFNQGPL